MNFDLPILAPSILAADISRLESEIRQCLDEGIKWIHCDIMDGHFVPNISFGPAVVEKVREIAPDVFLDVHLMIEDPDKFIDDFADAGADLISVHYEACPHLHGTIQNIKQNGCMAGVVINPATSIDLLEPILPDIDLVLIMTVNPGFGGQTFIENSYRRIQNLYHLRKKLQHQFLIEIDGGVNLENAKKIISHGVDVLVAGSCVFKADNIPERIATLRKLARSGSKKMV